jgi:HEAT repeat protein
MQQPGNYDPNTGRYGPPPPRPGVPIGPDGRPLHYQVDTSSDHATASLEWFFRIIILMLGMIVLATVGGLIYVGFRKAPNPLDRGVAGVGYEEYDDETDDSPSSDDGDVASSGISSVDEALAALESGDYSAEDVANFFLSALVDEFRRSQVSGALAEYLADTLLEQHVQETFVRAIERWNSPAAVPGLVRALRTRRLEDQAAELAMPVLAESNQSLAAEALAEQLGHSELGEEAEAALRTMDADVARPIVSAYVGSSIYLVDRRAGALMDHYDRGGTTNDVALRQRLDQLTDPSLTRRRAAASYFASASVDPGLRVEVVRALQDALTDADPLTRSILSRALETWQEDDDPVVSPENRGAVLAAQLDDLRRDDDATRQLIGMGPAAAPHVLPYLNDPRSRARGNARNILTALKVPDSELIVQSLDDLQSADNGRPRYAAEWLLTANLSDQQRQLCAERLVVLLDDDDYYTKRAAAKCLARWGTSKQIPQLVRLLEHSDEGVWSAALTTLLDLEDPSAIPYMQVPVAKLLYSTRKQQRAFADLVAGGRKSEDLAISLLDERADGIVVLGAVKVLEKVGAEKSLAPLLRIRDAAKRLKAPLIEDAARAAGVQIQARIRAAEGEGEVDADGEVQPENPFGD